MCLLPTLSNLNPKISWTILCYSSKAPIEARTTAAATGMMMITQNISISHDPVSLQRCVVYRPEIICLLTQLSLFPR